MQEKTKVPTRDEVRAEFMSTFKKTMQNNFRSNFVSTGEIEKKVGAPSISFRKCNIYIFNLRG